MGVIWRSENRISGLRLTKPPLSYGNNLPLSEGKKEPQALIKASFIPQIPKWICLVSNLSAPLGARPQATAQCQQPENDIFGFRVCSGVDRFA